MPPPPPRPPALGAIDVRDLTPPDTAPARVDAAAIAAVLRARLLASGQFGTTAEDGDGGTSAITRVQAQFAVDGAEVDDKGLARARMSLHLETRPEGALGAIDERLEGAGEEPYTVSRSRTGGRGAASGGERPAVEARGCTRRLVRRLAGDLIDGFAARRRLRQAGPEALRAALSADAGELRLEAIRTIGERHVASQSDALLALLNDPDETTRDAALGALIALGDRRAVTELTRTRSLRDRREMRKIIEAIAILGGQGSRRLLELRCRLARRRRDPRGGGAAARARLQRRRTDAAANPP